MPAQLPKIIPSHQMPATALSIPALVQPVSMNGQSVFQVRPLFFESPVATHRRYSEAITQFKGLMKRHFSHFSLYRQNAEQLLWFKIGPEVSLHHYNLDFSIGSHHVKGRFGVATFEWKGQIYACLPALENFLFIVSKNEAGKHEVRDAAEKVIRQLLRNLKRTEGNAFDVNQYYAIRKEFLTTVQLNVNVKDSDFVFEQDEKVNFMAAFSIQTDFHGGEELEKTAYDLCDKFPDELRRAYFQEALVQQIYDLVFRRSNTPLVLTGREGTGKHTIIEEVAWRYMHDRAKTDDPWKRHCFWHLNPNRIIAGMSIVGHWEKRFEAILEYVQKPNGRTEFPDKILIDNPVALLRIGKAAGSDLTLANVLKSYLEKRKVQLVLIATPEEWKIIQETDRGFSDLFQVIRLDEPNVPTALQIVLHNRRELEMRYDCTISVPAISQVFTIQRNYLKHKALPGSVMKMLTQLCAKYRRSAIDAPEVREEFRDFSGLQERIFDEQTLLEKDEMLDMLSHELVGQPMAVEALANAIHLVKAKLTDRNKPLASFLFIGPTGVGKTHAAKLLCKTILGNDEHLLRFDMNEYIDGGAIHRLIGDYNNPEGQLTGRVRYRPFSVVLLDEIEKAHPKIHDLLLQMLDDARLTDSLGRTVDFSNTIIVMTSNLGAREVKQQLGFQTAGKDDSAIYRKAVENFFRPELVNRIEQVVIFNPLEFSEIQKIAQLQIRELLQRDGFVRRTTIVNVSPEALDWVANRGFDPLMGGRALKRQIEKDLTLLSAEQLLRTTSDTPVILDILLVNDRLVPNITPLEFANPLHGQWLPHVPDDQHAMPYFKNLLKKIEKISDSVRRFEQKHAKRDTLIQVTGAQYDWKHHEFKNRVFDLKDAVLMKQLQWKERSIQMHPVLPFRLKRVYLSYIDDLGGKARKEALRDKFFQQEALMELREEYRHLSPQFDSFQTDYLVSFLDLAFLEIMLEGFLAEKTDKVTLKLESCVTNAGQEQIDFLLNLYSRLLTRMDILHQTDEQEQRISAEDFGLYKLLAGEEGIHLFYPVHNVPVPIRLTLLSAEKLPNREPGKVIRLYDGLESVTDLRTGYSNIANLTPDEFKLLIYGGQL